MAAAPFEDRTRFPVFTSFSITVKAPVAAALAGIALGLAVRSPAPAVQAEKARQSSPAASPPMMKPPSATANLRLAAVLAAGTPCAQAAAALGLLELGSVEEIQAVFRETGSFPGHAASGSVRAALFTRWLELDPQGAADYCRRNHPDLQTQLLDTWALTDAAAAMAWLEAQPDDEFHSTWNLRYHLATERDPDKAWAMLEKAPGLSRDDNYGVDPLMKRLVKQDPESAMAWLDTMAPALQPAVRREIVRQLMIENPARAWAWLAGLRGVPNPLDARTAGNGGPGMEAEAVIQRIESLNDTDGLIHTAKGAALVEWLHKDPEMAVSLMRNQHPVALWDMLNNNPLQPLKAEEAAALAGILRRDPLPEAARQDSLTGGFFQNLSGNEAVIIPQFFPLFSEEAQLKRIRGDLASWSKNDRRAAGAWLESLPAGPVRAAGEAALVEVDAPSP